MKANNPQRKEGLDIVVLVGEEAGDRPDLFHYTPASQPGFQARLWLYTGALAKKQRENGGIDLSLGCRSCYGAAREVYCHDSARVPGGAAGGGSVCADFAGSRA